MRYLPRRRTPTLIILFLSTTWPDVNVLDSFSRTSLLAFYLPSYRSTVFFLSLLHEIRKSFHAFHNRCTVFTPLSVVPETRRTCRFERPDSVDNSLSRRDFQFISIRTRRELAAVLSVAFAVPRSGSTVCTWLLHPSSARA